MDTAILPVRCLSGQWQVLSLDASEGDWINCSTEADARLIAKSAIYMAEIINKGRLGEEFAAELIRCAEALDRCGRRHNANFLRLGAARARGERTLLDDIGNR